MKIKQLISYPNPNELGMGNTNETYIRVENNLDVSDIFPPLQDIKVVDCISHNSYTLKAKKGTEFRINQLGPLYRDYNVCPGDEIKFTQIDCGEKTVLFSVVNHKRVYLNVTSKGTEIVNKERIEQFINSQNSQEYILKINEGILKISYDKSEKKRSDSPETTDFYKTTINGVELEKGAYFLNIKDNKNVLEEVTKNKIEEFVLEDNNTSTTSTETDKMPLQQIFYGAPGTGKSHTINEKTKGENVIRTTFHPDSDYSTFVGCYKPTMVEAPVRDGSGHEVKDAKQEEKNRISYSFVPQAFLKAYCEAWNKLGEGNNEPVYLIIEEINRGNCAQIFGDLFQLLDRKDDGYSDYPIDADEDLKRFLKQGTKEDGTKWLINEDGIKNGKLCLPPNLYIWATMNTSDQSLFPIDSAFKRRWEWKYMPISNAGENWEISINGAKYDWWSFIENINKKIDAVTHSEDKKLGYFFCKADNNKIISADKFVGKVLFYIYNDVFKDYGFDDSIFKDANDNNSDLTFQSFFMPDGKPNEEKVAVFMTNLGVEVTPEI